MNIEIWEEFGKNLEETKNFDYFPSEWTEKNSNEFFIDYPKEYKKENCNEKNLPTFFPIPSGLEKKFTGFFKVLPDEDIRIGNYIYPANFVFVNSGKIKYLQESFNQGNFSTKKTQIFFDENFLVEKVYSLDINDFYGNDDDEYEILGKPFNEEFLKEQFEDNLKKRKFFISENLKIPLVYVSRELRSDMDKGFYSRYIQEEKSNFSFLLYKEPKKEAIGYFKFNSKDLSHYYYINEIKKNPSILENISDVQDLFKNLNLFPNKSSFKSLGGINSKKFKNLFS